MQKYRAHDFAKAQVLAIHQEYAEPGVSARKKRVDERPQMTQLMKDIRDGKIDTLIVYKRDRLARRATEYMDFYRLCKKHQVKILFSAENEFPVYYTPLGEFIELIMAGMVEHEGNQIAERLSATHLANFLKRKTLQPILPYGIKKVKRKDSVWATFIDEDYKRTVRTIFQVILNRGLVEGDTPTEKKSRFLSVINDEFKLRRHGKGGLQPWSWSAVVDVIGNPIYRGVHEREFGGQVYERDQPDARVVTDDEWHRANDIIESFKPKQRQVPPYTFLLEHVAKCARCNGPLQCHTRHHNDLPIQTYECKDCSIQINATRFHNTVLDEVLLYIDQLFAHHAGELYRQYRNEKAKHLRMQISSAKAALQEAEEQFIDAVSSDIAFVRDFRDPVVVGRLAVFQSSVDKLRKKLRTLEQELHDESLLPHVVVQRTDRLQKLQDLIDEFLERKINQVQVKDLLEDIVEHVVVDKPETVNLTLKCPFETIKEVARRERA